MDIKAVDSSCEKQIKKIMQCCYPSAPEEQVDEFLEEVVRAGQCFGMFDGDVIVSTLSIRPFSIHYWGKIVDMGGIQGVATPPEFRGRRYAGDLLVKSLEILRDTGTDLVFLAPSSYPFYRRYGWELGFHAKRYRFEVGALEPFHEDQGRYMLLDEGSADDVSAVYEAFAMSFNGPLRRSREAWIKRLSSQPPSGYCYGYIDDSNVLQAYLQYTLCGKSFHIHELAYKNLPAKKAMLGFAALFGNQVQEVTWTAPLDDDTDHLLADPPTGTEILPGMMIRIVDVARLLGKHPFSTATDRSFVLQVEDPSTSWNQDPIRATVRHGRVQVERARESEVHFACTIQTLSQIMIGKLSLSRAAALALVEIRNGKVFEGIRELFPDHATFIADSF